MIDLLTGELELCHRDDYAYHPLAPTVEGRFFGVHPFLKRVLTLFPQAYLIFMVTNASFIPLVYFCYPVSSHPSLRSFVALALTNHCQETSNLTLEEVDHLFTAEGQSGLSGLKGPIKPVKESLKLDVEKTAGGSTEHVEASDEIGNQKSN